MKAQLRVLSISAKFRCTWYSTQAADWQYWWAEYEVSIDVEVGVAKRRRIAFPLKKCEFVRGSKEGKPITPPDRKEVIRKVRAVLTQFFGGVRLPAVSYSWE